MVGNNFFFTLFTGDNRNTCCDDAQAVNLRKGIAMIEPMLRRCPSCYINFARQFCDLTCRPDQSKFMKATKVVGDGKRLLNQTWRLMYMLINESKCFSAVTEVDYYISFNYTYEAYLSCKYVYLPLSNQHIFDAICGKDFNSCTMEDWYSVLGSNSPFKIDFKFSNDTVVNGFEPRKIRAFRCNEQPTVAYI